MISEVPPEEDAITYPHWMETLSRMAELSDDHNTQELALMAKSLFQINRHDPETIAYMNGKARDYMERVEK